MSCEKSLEDRCFENFTDKIFESYKEQNPLTVQDILKNKPEYLTISTLKNYRSFKEDSISTLRSDDVDEAEQLKKHQDHKLSYAKFDSLFHEQFGFYAKQSFNGKEYALAKNELGFWLTKIEDNDAKAYFLGLSFSHYYINEIQTEPMIKNGELQLQGSLVKIIKVGGLSGYDDYSAIDDGKLFRIKLSDLKKDSDKDGYNDIFEESFGLDPYSTDTDSDGIDDFNDLNPLFKSEKNKFTSLFQQILPKYQESVEGNLRKMNYFFTVYGNDCGYFQQIDPEHRTLIVSEDIDQLPYYLQVTDVINGGVSKIRKTNSDPDQFYISVWGNSSERDYAVKFKNGRWEIKETGGMTI